MNHLSAFIGVVFLLAQISTAQVIQPSQTCGECHKRSFFDWQTSQHAKSESNPFFLQMLQTLQEEESGRLAKCQGCHMPLKSLELDPLLQKKLSGESINCDFCHATDLKRKQGRLVFRVKDGKTKYGPLKDAIASSHECQYSPLFEKAEFCLSCHRTAQESHGEFFPRIGEEWHASKWAKIGVSCQDCHMPAITGVAAELGKLRNEIHSHSFLAGRSAAMLRNSVSIDLTAETIQDGFHLKVTLTNQKAGHSIPSGSPLRMLYLTVKAYDVNNSLIWSNWQNDPLKEDPQSLLIQALTDDESAAYALPWSASGIAFDQRLRPGAPYTCEYLLPLATAARIEAELIYGLASSTLLEKFKLKNNPNYRQKPINKAILRLL
ncbi:MAG TPA: multiheme c-type cytochrome [bacterium]|mgnify:CR=1 FL=1|nr:multiheme c-type cytochrome [bacterium]HNT65451.1 multiheme c-type cytochrome [bacterium]HOX87143.1 multiheme c-type cytochrome [bacterium]HPG46474.1 multiheme c-type cytochrome [bacterium]HPM98613.1 multiheme c-type cytochrome [bacterium]